jgi:hypothetical protein
MYHAKRNDKIEAMPTSNVENVLAKIDVPLADINGVDVVELEIEKDLNASDIAPA